MIDLLTLTNSPTLAAACDALPGMRLFVDLERNGKAERQAGRNTFISSHQIGDVGRVKAALRHTRLMVRVNPFDALQAAAAKMEVDAVIAQGADMIMLPMFTSAPQLREFAAIVAGRVPLVPLLETAGALTSLDDWISAPGIAEVFVGLNDLHVSLGCRFMFEPLVLGHVDRVATAAGQHGLRFGFGGIARVGEGLLPGQDVLAEHLRLGSQAVILSRTFNRADEATTFEQAVAELRHAERALALRTAAAIEADRLRTAGLIKKIAGLAGQPGQTA